MFDIWDEYSIIAKSQYKKANYMIENKRGGIAIYFAPRIIYGFQMKKYTLKRWYMRIDMNGLIFRAIKQIKQFIYATYTSHGMLLE